MFIHAARNAQYWKYKGTKENTTDSLRQTEQLRK